MQTSRPEFDSPHSIGYPIDIRRMEKEKKENNWGIGEEVSGTLGVEMEKGGDP